MRVYIGPYKNWWGPYQIAKLLRCVGFSKKRCKRIGEWLNSTRFLDVCEWIHARRKRTIKIRIDNYDVWGMDHTLALIVVPLLKRLKEKKQGAPLVDDEDVPENLKSINAPPLTEEEKSTGSPDANWHSRWDWIIDEIIWSFEQILEEEEKFSNPFDFEAYKAHQTRIQNGMCLFGKYLRGMWD